jgi:hypothetical protein
VLPPHENWSTEQTLKMLDSICATQEPILMFADIRDEKQLTDIYVTRVDSRSKLLSNIIPSLILTTDKDRRYTSTFEFLTTNSNAYVKHRFTSLHSKYDKSSI